MGGYVAGVLMGLILIWLYPLPMKDPNTRT